MGSLRDTCVKPCVTCVVCSVRRVHGAGYGRAEHMCSRGEPLGLRGLFFYYARVTSWLPARVVGVRQEGVIPCRMVPSMWDEVHVQLHDVTGKVQHARLIISAQRRELRVAALDAHVNLNRINLEYEKSKPRFRVDMISRGRGERPPVLGHRINH